MGNVMELPEVALLPYAKAWDWSKSHALRLSEVPVEHAVYPPLPTKARGPAAYIQAAAPALRRFGQPVSQGAPDRWWLFDARGGRLLQYALTVVAPLSADSALGPCEYVSPAASVEALRADQAALADAMGPAAQAFFEGHPAAPGQGARILALLAATTAVVLIAQYRVIAPDFFAWLDA
jgi:hypothetical protein